ncbi:type II toxin-antitoxin system VapC family toxin [Leucobacter sp. wl10]|uniref:type II toxin-antitoxin system VapC family toxin n=1 Tax=Leucobacter sp. wl10 TaxID=2304677 RepID=UPI000E5B428E|nr:type II toxin-antitoxin system VapC family toxin [Leucobacter sp. wl10]RGE20756.1 PIN domain-containing protein [Leucobacter sp. wl10]
MIPEIMEDAVLLDANIAIYALSDSGRYKAPSIAMLRDLAAGRGRGYASTEMIQEVVHHRQRVTGDRELAVQEGRDLMAMLTILKFDHEVLDTSLKLIEQLPGVGGRDAVHAATALAYGIEKIASTDRGFDGIPGITRIDPTADR